MVIMRHWQLFIVTRQRYVKYMINLLAITSYLFLLITSLSGPKVDYRLETSGLDGQEAIMEE